MQNEELETWLAEVDLAHNYINKLKNNEISIEELDKKELQKQQEKQKKEQKQKRLEEEREEQIKLGRQGKGNDKNYASFCRHCFREYERLTPQCVHCQHTTISKEERHSELMKKVEEFKKNKIVKTERKKKWELWKKTKAMMWKKSSTNYTKWDVFTSSSEDESEKVDPILPKNDPNFIAMEKDIEERANKRKRNRKEAEQLKVKANEFMSQKNYQKAIEIYSEALELSRDFIILYTNRALAYIKIKKFKNAVEDCTKVTDYCECFEDGYLKSKDTCIKALLRRALANKELGKYYESRQDIREIQKIAPDNLEAAKLYEEIQFLEEHKKQADRILKTQQEQQQQQQKNNDENDNQKEQIINNTSKDKTTDNITDINSQQVELKDMKSKVNAFLKNQELSPDEISKFCSYITKNQDAKIYFFEQKGNIKLIEMLKKNIQNSCLLVNFFLQNNFIYQEEFYKKKGVFVMFEKISENLAKLHQIQSQIQKQPLQQNGESIAKEQGDAYDSLEEYFEIFVTLTNQEKMRNTLNQSQEMADMIQKLMPLCLDAFEEEPELVSSFLSFISNLCYGPPSLIKKHIESQLTMLFPKLQEIIVFHKKKTSFENLRVNIYNFLQNLLTETSIRQQFHLYKGLIQVLISQFDTQNFSNNRWVARAEALLAVFINATFQQQQQSSSPQPQQQQQQQQLQSSLQQTNKNSNEILDVLQAQHLNNKLQRFLFSSKSELYRNVTLRTLQVLSKLKFVCSTDLSIEFLDKIIKNYFNEEAVVLGFANHGLRLMLTIIDCASQQASELEYFQSLLKEDLLNNLCVEIVKIIQGEDYQRFCNACNLAGKIVQIFPNTQQTYTCVIERLLFIIKEKVGLERKNAAILIGKLAKNEQNLELIRSLHGIEILHSLSQFLL